MAVAAAGAASDTGPTPDLLAPLVREVAGLSAPFGEKSDQYVALALLSVAKAFCMQPSAVRRDLLAPALASAASAFMARLNAVTPDAPSQRHRADLDD